MNLDPNFSERIRTQLEDADNFFNVLDGIAPTSIRLNRQKVQSATELPQGDPIPWNPDGIMLAERPRYSRMPDYHAGLYYPMEASSMALDAVLLHIEPGEGELLLDLCGAPGGKSLILKDRFPHNILVSNDIDAQRAGIIVENAMKWGTKNHVVISSEAARISQSDLKFKVVLVDAPCSGEGLFRKDPDSRREWTVERAAGCALRQTNILDDTVEFVARGGYIIYSTCTYNPQENMEQVMHLKEVHGFENVPVDLGEMEGVQVLEEGGVRGYQFWPHRIYGEGFFISALRKSVGEEPTRIHPSADTGDNTEVFDWLSLPSGSVLKGKSEIRFREPGTTEVIERLKKHARILRDSVLLAFEKGGNFLPSQELAYTEWAHQFPLKYELNLNEALSYIQGQALPLRLDKGIYAFVYNGLVLGFGKSIGNRVNNLYPKHLRARF